MKSYRIEVNLGGIEVAVKSPYCETCAFFRRYVSKGKPQIKISVRRREVEEEKRQLGEFLDSEYPDWYFSHLAIHRKLTAKAVSFDILLFHASAVMVEGEAYVFAAPSGTGKSTHTALWRKTFGKRVQIINDDKPFVRMEEGRWFVYGSPWNGKHGLDNNVKAPLKAICFLEQAKENEISRIDGRDGFPRLCKQIFFPQDRRLCERAVGLAGTLSKVPMFLLKCNISEEAARMSYGAMRGE